MTTVQPDKNIPTERPITVLLIDDQPIVAESVRRMLASEPDIRFHYCQEPAKAIETANRVQPTVILQDLVMPDIDGLMLVKFFRANKATRDMPMIVLSSKEEPTIKAQAFALGANDYIVKLPDRLEVVARLRYHSRGYIALLERNEAYARLAESQELLANEVATAARYVKSLLPEALEGPVRHRLEVRSLDATGRRHVRLSLDRPRSSRHLPAGRVGPRRRLVAAGGLGLERTVVAVAAEHRFPRARTGAVAPQRRLPDGPPGQQVFHDLVRRLSQVRPDAGVLQRRPSRRAAVHRPDQAGATLHNLASTDPIIGMLPPGMPFKTQRTALGPYARLLVFSDGVFEIERPDGVMWQFPEFVEYVSTELAGLESVIEPLLAKVRQLRGGDLLADDFSLLEARL